MEYKNSFVVFLDVLGFKNMVNSEDEKIEKYLQIVNKQIKYLEGIEEKKDIKSIVISDSIILSVETTDNQYININTLRNLCLFVALIQEALALENIWLRGAISYGKTYFDEESKQIVGKGYINAYELESSLAKYPRVILDNKIINILELEDSNRLIEKINDDVFENWNGNILYNWGRNVLIGNLELKSYSMEKDIPLFIDYLDNLKNTGKIDTIIENIKKSVYSSTSIYDKFRWVSNYIISKYSSNEENKVSNRLKDI